MPGMKFSSLRFVSVLAWRRKEKRRSGQPSVKKKKWAAVYYEVNSCGAQLKACDDSECVCIKVKSVVMCASV